jgi:hypothetical protein
MAVLLLSWFETSVGISKELQVLVEIFQKAETTDTVIVGNLR